MLARRQDGPMALVNSQTSIVHHVMLLTPNENQIKRERQIAGRNQDCRSRSSSILSQAAHLPDLSLQGVINVKTQRNDPFKQNLKQRCWHRGPHSDPLKISSCELEFEYSHLNAHTICNQSQEGSKSYSDSPNIKS